MKKGLSLTVLLLALSPMANAVPITWEENGHTYEVVTRDTDLTWGDARSLAESMGGHLVTLTSVGENYFVAWLVQAYGVGNLERYWLGGYQTDGNNEPGGSWAWVTGEQWDYTNWAPGEPNNGVGGTQHYLHYWPRPGLWDDMENRRGVMNSLVVEYRPVPEPGTIALLGLGLFALGMTRRRRHAINS